MLLVRRSCMGDDAGHDRTSEGSRSTRAAWPRANLQRYQRVQICSSGVWGWSEAGAGGEAMSEVLTHAQIADIRAKQEQRRPFAEREGITMLTFLVRDVD